MSFGFGMGAISGGGGVSARSVPVASSSTGRVVALTRLLGSASTFSLLSGTDASITLDSGNGLALSAAVGAGTSVIAQVREQVGSGATARAVEYAVKISGTPVKPSVPAVTLTAGNGQISVAWTDGSNGGSAIFQHNIYDNGVLIGSPTGAGPFVISGLPNDVLHGPIQVSAVNGVGEGALSTGQSAKPSAVAFRLDNAINLQRWTGLRTPGALGITDTPWGVLSFWMRGSVGSAASSAIDSAQYYSDAIRMLMGNDTSDTGGNSEGSAGLNIILDTAQNAGVSTRGTFRLNLADAGSTAGAGKTNHSWEGSAYSKVPDKNGQWVHFLFAWDGTSTAAGAGNKRQALYINGVNQQIPAGATEYGTLASAFKPALSGGKGWQFNYWGDGYVAINGGMSEYAQVLLDNTTSIVQNPVGGYCSIDPAIVSRFYSNGPVDYGTNGSLPLGFQPQFFWDGDKTSFLTNKGAAGAVGNLSAIGTTPYVSNSGFGPSGVPSGRVGHVFTSDSGSTSGTNATSKTLHLGGNTLQTGDLLMLFSSPYDSSGASVDHGLSLPADAYGGTWNLLADYRANGATGRQTEVAVYWKLATAADVSAANAGTWTATQTATTAPTRTWNWAILAYRGCDQTTPIAAQAVYVQSKLSTGGGVDPTTPSITTTKPNSTIIHIVSSDNQAPSPTPPSQINLRLLRVPTGGSFPILNIGDEVQAAVGASVGRTWTYATKNPSQAIAIALNPA